MEDRDAMRNKSGDLNRDLSEKEAQPGVFESGRQPVIEGRTSGEEIEGTFGDSRPDETDPREAHFVDGSDDPNMRVTRQTSELTQPERGLADEMNAIRHDDS